MTQITHGFWFFPADSLIEMLKNQGNWGSECYCTFIRRLAGVYIKACEVLLKMPLPLARHGCAACEAFVPTPDLTIYSTLLFYTYRSAYRTPTGPQDMKVFK